jgi:hypothetical protein
LFRLLAFEFELFLELAVLLLLDFGLGRYHELDNLEEDLVNIFVVLSTGVDKAPSRLDHALGLLIPDFLLINQIRFIADQHNSRHPLAVLLDGSDPLLDFLEASSAAYVEYDDDGVAVSVVQLKK